MPLVERKRLHAVEQTSGSPQRKWASLPAARWLPRKPKAVPRVERTEQDFLPSLPPLGPLDQVNLQRATIFGSVSSLWHRLRPKKS